MKKNISINISGIIFHIEEDGYENLRKYLDSINKYFSSFEDSSEILADIESRIAEIFLSKLNEGKQVITADDVHSLISTMGSVNDFKAAEEQEFSQQGKSSKQSTNDQKSYSPPKQLLRDQKRKTLGGVCAGIGSYLNVDPVWIRLIFALLAFVYGITIIAYIIMWIVVPGSFDLEEPEISKKMFRDSDRKVLGGVAGGLAAYLGIDVVAMRVLFIVFMFAGGLGFLIYIVLWVVLPEAKTLTDKMQMQGEPVTLSNIESNLKKNQNLGGNEDETPLTKILLFPFRLIAMLLTGLAKILGPIVDVFRVAIGIIIMLVGLSLILGFVISGGVLIGLLTGHSLPIWWGADFNEIGFPVEIFQNTFPPFTTLAAFVLAVIPAIFIMLLGISAIAKRIVFGAAVGWTLFVLFFASVAVLAISVPRIIYSFKEEGEYKTENRYQPIGKTVVLKLSQTGLDDYKVTSLSLKGYDEKGLKLVQTFEAHGSTKQNAIDNAHMIDYHVDFRDSTLTFDSNIQFKKDARFRAQQLKMTLYIPYNMPFIMNEDISRFVSQIVKHENLDGNTWKMTPAGLTCITCETDNEDVNDEENKDGFSSHDDLTDFDAIDINGLVNATIKQGDNYSVELFGPEDVKSKYNIYRSGNTLVIENKNDYKYFWKRLHTSEIHINITMPNLEKLEAKGAGKITFENFDTTDMEIEVLGAMSVTGEAHTHEMKINISGASTLTLKGNSENMDVTILGASNLNAYDFEVNDANVEANGASNAKVHVNRTLDMEEGIASHIDYRGHPEVNKHN